MIVSPAIRSVQPPEMWPSICGRRDCAHIQCINIRIQNHLKCLRCRRSIPAGADVYIVERGEFGSVTKQICATCFEARP